MKGTGLYAIIGAGLAGLTAARALQAAGRQVVVLDKARGVGGRMATRRFDGVDGSQPIFDHGAQFFTVREEAFARLVAEWQAAGVVAEWSRGFATADGSYYADGYPRYRGEGGMTAVPKYLAQGLDIRLNCRVTTVQQHNRQWQITTADGPTHTADGLILTPPVPQALALLDAGQTSLPEAQRRLLDQLSYEPCLALMVQLDGPSSLPEPGGMWPLGEPIAWLADNYRKGVSPVPGAVTIHAGPEFSQQHWDSSDDAVIERLLDAAEPWLGAPVRRCRLHRWRYSRPFVTHPEPCLVAQTPAPLVFAGDVFAGPRVEGAVLSGLAAAEHLEAL